MPGPLAGIRVLDLAAYIAGPYACTLLGDQGAEVIKIEPPEGDNLRNYPSTLEGESRAFVGINRGKRGVVLNLKSAAGQSQILRLAQSADVLVHNFRPGVPARLGIAYETLSALNARLIYCTLSGYGQSGPMQHKAGYDQVLQAFTGMAAEQAKPGGPPELLYGSVVDYFAASLLSGAVSSALYEREKSGLGQAVSVSLLGAAMAMQSARLVWAEGEPKVIARDMRSGGITGIHPTRAGHIYISANTPAFWAALCKHTGLDTLAVDPRYQTVKQRAAHAEALVTQLRAALQTQSAVEWEARFGDEVPCAAVRPVEDLFECPQAHSEGHVESFAHAAIGSYQGFQNPMHFSRSATLSGASPRAAPRLGEHSEVILTSR